MVVGLVLIGASAGIYFFVLKKPPEQSGPEKTVVKFFEVVGSGDSESFAALYTPESRPDEAQMRLISLMFGSSGVKMDDIKTKLVSENATDAQVEVVDLTMTANGQSVKMSELGSDQSFSFKLKQVNGEWLIEASEETPFLPSTDQLQMPTVPQGST